MDHTILQAPQQQQTLTRSKLEEDLSFIEAQTHVQQEVQTNQATEHQEAQTATAEHQIQQTDTEQTAEKHKGKTFVSRVKEKDRKGRNSGASAKEVKSRVGTFASKMRERVSGLPQNAQSKAFEQMLQSVEAYTQLQRSTKLMDYSDTEKEESVAMEHMMEQLRLFTETYVTELANEEGRATLRAQLDCAFELQAFYTNRSLGNLPKDEPGALKVDMKPTYTGFMGACSIERDMSNRPLFPHEPSLEDIKQRALGDCYLLAGLGSVISTKPHLIRECMRDNQDGTVTVRFYRTGVGEGVPVVPVHVTVTKKVPRLLGAMDTYNGGSLWVQMIERAYAASGLHLTERGASSAKKTEAEVRLMNSYTVTHEKGHRTPEDLAQLAKRQDLGDYVDKHGKVSLVGGSYEDIAGGHAHEFIHALLGEAYKKETHTVREPTIENAFAEAWEHYEVEHRAEETTRNEGLDALNATVNQQYKEREAAWRQEKKALMIQKARLKDMSPEERAEYDRMTVANSAMIGQLTQEKHGIEFSKHSSMFDDFKLFVEDHLKELKEQGVTPNQAQFAQVSADIVRAYLTKKQEVQSEGTYQAYVTFINALLQKSDFSGDSTWNALQESLSQGKMLGASTKALEGKRSGVNNETANDGLFGHHAYTLLDTEVREIGGKEYRFVKLRNPWGTRVRDYYQEEGDSTLKYQEQGEGNDGVFLVEYQDFLRSYDTVNIN